ncbi:zinc finger protein-domain-containing protein [Diplogelasinospora grovesii]|uniref:Zinc finger protein-domain-containing protein n=1 Tax=Diplogelasinospora grovesii TaxID=303347 RepID=A0AAN6N545_9PEZI|nr:zinc finger protein-domain-containing protein [Diplogelasinospora grovesii]
MDAAINRFVDSQVPLRKIGQGFCGTVWADLDENGDLDGHHHLALKREDGGPGRSILHEHLVHKRLLETIQKTSDVNLARFRVNLPFCEGLLLRDSPHWPRILPRLPPGFEPCNALVNEKIPSMPGRVCTLLARIYHPEAISSPAVATAINDHCLVRPYLGRRRHRPHATAARARPNRLLVFSLRNFPLHIDQIEQLNLPAGDYAVAMADALAFLHWTARVDANDVEFVLAPARGPPNATKPSPGIGSIGFQSEALGTHTMWVLDFDCCRDMPMNEAGVKQAARSFLRNDPFYPRPPSSRNPTASDEKLWNTFRSRFLETSRSILREEAEFTQQLPVLLMEEIVRTSVQENLSDV